MPSGVVLVAAGRGRRLGRRLPKQFLDLNGEPLYLRSLRTFLKTPSVREVVVVVNASKVASVARRLRTFAKRKSVRVVAGGRHRGESVRNGVKALSSHPPIVLVHDAARPLVTSDIIRRVEKAAQQTGVALAAWPLADTAKLTGVTGLVRKTIPRKNIWLAQTPQGFRRSIAAVCLLRPAASATDDVTLAERKGYRVQVVKGSPTNLKVTTSHDLNLCRLLIR